MCSLHHADAWSQSGQLSPSLDTHLVAPGRPWSTEWHETPRILLGEAGRGRGWHRHAISGVIGTEASGQEKVPHYASSQSGRDGNRPGKGDEHGEACGG